MSSPDEGSDASADRSDKVVVSACLVGRECTYQAGHNRDDAVARLVEEGRAVLVCPEVDGGLPTPRPPAEIQGGTGADVLDGTAAVHTADGADVTEAYLTGARTALHRSRRAGARLAVLKARSPSCGCGEIYDGTFTRTTVRGDGVTAATLRREGLRVVTEEDPDLPGLIGHSSPEGTPPMHPFRKAIEARDLDAAIGLLHEDVVFKSPVVHTPYHGRQACGHLFRHVAQTLEDFRYVDELGGQNRSHGLVFTAHVGDKLLDGWDYFVEDDDGRIVEFTVMIRPLSGLIAVAQAMQARLEDDPVPVDP